MRQSMLGPVLLAICILATVHGSLGALYQSSVDDKTLQGDVDTGPVVGDFDSEPLGGEAGSSSQKLLSAGTDDVRRSNASPGGTSKIIWPAFTGLASVSLVVFALFSCAHCSKKKRETLVQPMSEEKSSEHGSGGSSDSNEALKKESETITVGNTVSVTIAETAPMETTSVKSMTSEVIEVESVKSIEIKSVTSIERVKVKNNDSMQSNASNQIQVVERTLEDRNKETKPEEPTLEERLKKLLKEGKDDNEEENSMGGLPGQTMLGGGGLGGMKKLSLGPGAPPPSGRRGTRKMTK